VLGALLSSEGACVSIDMHFIDALTIAGPWVLQRTVTRGETAARICLSYKTSYS